MIKDNVGKFNECFGCSVCSLSCPQNIIEIKKCDGFLRPVISNVDQCIQCGICLKTCSFNSRDNLTFSTDEVSLYSAQSKDSNVLRTTTSGGTAYELFKHAALSGYEVMCVQFDNEGNRPVYFIASSIDDLEKSKGSKYMQADFSSVKDDIDWKKKYFVIGTPCAIASFRRLIKLKRKEGNFILLDFFCHGMPSFKLWNSYLKMRGLEPTDIRNVVFRPKDFGWHQSYRVKLYANDTKIISPPPKEDVFFKFFLGDRCLQKSCYDDCMFKQLKSCADIRIGDLWGHKYRDNESGVSGVVVLTSKGDHMIRHCTGIELKEEKPETILKGQMKKNACRAKSYRLASWGLNHEIPLSVLRFICNLIDDTCHMPKRIQNKLKRL